MRGQGFSGSARTDHVIQVSNLAPAIKWILSWESVQHRGHPPRETLDHPHAPQTDIRVLVQEIAATFRIVVVQPSREDLHVRNRQIKPFRACWRDNVCGIASEK